VLDSGCTNHMTGLKHIFTSFEENDCQVTQSCLVTLVKEGYLGMVKLLSLLLNLFQKFYLLILWTIICCPCHNYVRWTTIIYLLSKVVLQDPPPWEPPPSPPSLRF
jgi:hypothetical protein